MKIIAPTEVEKKQINEGIRLDPDNGEWTDEMFARAVRGRQKAPTKTQLTVRFDPDVVDWFKSTGQGYQVRMNDALRQYMNERNE